MQLHPKFIVENDCLIISKVAYHRDLATDRKSVKGGGLFRFLPETNTFVFYGMSYDFGAASLEDVKKCIELGNVYSNKLKTHSIAKEHHFAYDTGTEIVNL